MQRITKYLALACVLKLGATAQIVVSEPPIGYEPPGRISRPSAHIQDKNPPVSAIVLDVKGPTKYSVDGKKFRNLKKNTELPKRAIVKTGSTGQTELFVKRMGATLRVEPGSEISLERLQLAGKDEHQALNTKVTVRKGKAVTVVHANVAGSSLDIRNAGGKSISDPVHGSRYVVSADSIENAGPDTAPAGDLNPKMAAAIKEQMEFDEIQALAESWSSDENPGLEP